MRRRIDAAQVFVVGARHQLVEIGAHDVSGARRVRLDRTLNPTSKSAASIDGTSHDAFNSTGTAGPTPMVLRIERAPRLNSSGGQSGGVLQGKST